MQGSLQTRQAPDCSHAAQFVEDHNGIGALFRDLVNNIFQSTDPIAPKLS